MTTDNSDAKNSGTEDKRTLKEVINTTPFHILFDGTPKVQTTSLSSVDIASNATTKSTPIYDVPLSSIRTLTKLSNRLLFCVDNQNRVPDKTSLGYYISLTKDNVTAIRASDGQVPAIINVRFISKYSPPEPNPVSTSSSQGNASAGADGAGFGNGGPAAGGIAGNGIDGARSTQYANTAGILAGSDIVSTHVATMTESQWHIVMVTNSLLNGFHYDGATGLLITAREPAFKLKRSYPDPYGKLGADVNDSTSQATTTNPLYAIPWFQVADESSVTVSEVKSELQLSMAKNAFSSWNVEAAASGGISGITGGLSVAGSSSSNNSSGSSQGKAMDALHVSYNFPRVTVYFDADDLELSEACSTLLETIKTKKNAKDIYTFQRKFGFVFTTTVQLGGRLHSTRDVSTLSASSASAKKDAMKLAAGANFSSPFGSASLSAGYGHGSGNENAQSNAKSQEALTWEAQGGETLLGSNPASWIASVGSFYNWRVMQRDGLCDILRLIQEITAFDWPATFNTILHPPSTGNHTMGNYKCDACGSKCKCIRCRCRR